MREVWRYRVKSAASEPHFWSKLVPLGSIFGDCVQFWYIVDTWSVTFRVSGARAAQEKILCAQILKKGLPGGTRKSSFAAPLSHFLRKVRFCKTMLPCRREHRFDNPGYSKITLSRLKVRLTNETRPKGEPTPPPFTPLLKMS